MKQSAISRAICWSPQSKGSIQTIRVTQCSNGNGKINIDGKIAEDTLSALETVIKVIQNRNDVPKGYLNLVDTTINLPCAISGPSAALAMLIALYAATKEIQIPMDVGITGALNEKGEVTEVGMINDKINAAKHAGLKEIIIPWDNWDETDNYHYPFYIHPVKNINEAFTVLKF